MQIVALGILLLASTALHAEHPAFYNGKFGGSISKSDAFWFLGSNQNPKGRSDIEIRIKEDGTATVVLERDMLYPARFELKQRGEKSNLLKFIVRTAEGELTRYVVFDTSKRAMIPLRSDRNEASRFGELNERDRLPVLDVKLEPLPADAPKHIRDMRAQIEEFQQRMGFK